MEAVGLNSEVLAGGKKFHIQTNIVEPGNKIISNVFDKGRVIIKKESLINGETDDEIKDLVQSLHKDVTSELQLLFYISEKVQTIKHAASNNKLGIVFSNRQLYDEAIKEFKKAIELDDGFTEAYKNLGEVYLKNKQYDEALATLTDGLAKQSDFPDLHNSLGMVYLEQGQYVEAIAAFNAALAKNSYFTKSHLNLSVTLLKSIMNDIDEDELPSFDKRREMAISHIQIVENFIDSDKLIEAYQHFDDDDLEKTVEVLQEVNRENYTTLGTDIENEFYLKFMFGGKGKDDAFIQEHILKLKELINKYPKYADLRNNLGIAYLIQCRNLFLNALEEFRQALKINPGFKKAEKNLKLAENDGKGFLILLRAILK
ncbi:tetratricopeptide repeat protein [candidate division KSB1 bacterium]|nr:tetratricopeptide repeat protein [candidate division KSB1 bacterium]